MIKNSRHLKKRKKKNFSENELKRKVPDIKENTNINLIKMTKIIQNLKAELYSAIHRSFSNIRPHIWIQNKSAKIQ